MPRKHLARTHGRGVQPKNPHASPPRRLVPGPATDLVIIGVFAILFYIGSLLPPFRLSAIEIQGAQRLNPAFVADAVKRVMAESRLGIFPLSSYFYLNTTTLERSLQAKLQPIVPLNNVTIKKRFPKSLVVQLTESQPAATLITKTSRFLLDHNGTITGPGSADDDQLYPTIEETNIITMNLGDQVLSPAVLAAIPQLRTTLEQRNLGPVHFATPQIHCPLTTVTQPIIEPNLETPSTSVNRNANTNRDSSQTIVPPTMVESVCDLKAELTRSRELTIITGEGWKILLDTTQPLGETMDSLFLALDTKLTNRTSLHQVDLRFPPKLFYQ